jgi:hypothetical protein
MRCNLCTSTVLTLFLILIKRDFKGGFVGNPIGGTGSVDKLAEPEGGWDSLGESTKTTTWKNRFDGVTINLVGIDSLISMQDRPKIYLAWWINRM